MGAVVGLLPGRELLPAAPVGHPDGAAGASVGFVRPAGRAGLAQSVGDAVGAGRAEVVDRTGQRREAQISFPDGSARTWTFMPCRLCLSE